MVWCDETMSLAGWWCCSLVLLADTTPAVAGVGCTANDRNQSHAHQEAGSWMDNNGRIAVVDENETNWLVLNERGKCADLGSERRCCCKVGNAPKMGHD